VLRRQIGAAQGGVSRPQLAMRLGMVGRDAQNPIKRCDGFSIAALVQELDRIVETGFDLMVDCHSSTELFSRLGRGSQSAGLSNRGNGSQEPEFAPAIFSFGQPAL